MNKLRRLLSKSDDQVTKISANNNVRLCVDWLKRIGIFPHFDKPVQSPEGLMHVLQDGLLLCSLANVISPGCINVTIFETTTKSSFTCRRNMNEFVKFCQHVIDIFDHQIYDTVIDADNLDKVISLLSKISNTPISLEVASPGFIYHEPKEELISKRYDSDDDDDSESPYLLVMKEQRREKYESIYMDIIMQDGDYQTVSSPSQSKIFPGTNTEMSTSSKDVHKSNCNNIIRELLDTEKKYLETLDNMTTYYCAPLEDFFIGTEKIFFGKLDDIRTLHSCLHDELKISVSKGISTISDCFIKYKLKFLVYGFYCAHIIDVTNRLLHLQNTPHFNSKYEACKSKLLKETSQPWPLTDLLVVPFQRLTKYPLLLGNLLKVEKRVLELNEEEMNSLKQALEAITDVVNYVNEVTRDKESLEELEEIRRSIINLKFPGRCEMKSYGRLRQNGDMKVTAIVAFSTGQPKSTIVGDLSVIDKKQRLYLFLFDKALFICTMNSGNCYILELALSLYEFMLVVDATSGCDNRIGLFGSKHFSLVQDVSVSGGTKPYLQRIYTFTCNTVRERENWIESFEMAKESHQPTDYKTAGHYFVQYDFPEDEVTECSYCLLLLKGIWFQGYRCTRCGQSSHRDCIRRASACLLQLTTPLRNRLPELENRTNFDVELPETSFPTKLSSLGDSNVDYSTKPWYAGDMSNEEANSTLSSLPNGAYLVRCSINAGGFVLSVKCTDSSKHIRIKTVVSATSNVTTTSSDCNPADGVKYFYFVPGVHFRSLSDLLTHYSENNLQEIFSGLDTPLIQPFKECLDTNNNPVTDEKSSTMTDVKSFVPPVPPRSATSHLRIRPSTNDVVNISHHSKDNIYSLSPKSSNESTKIIAYVIVTNDFHSSLLDKNPLHLKQGDIIEVINKDHPKWWKGRNPSTGHVGCFPPDYVDTVPDGKLADFLTPENMTQVKK